VRSGQAPKGRSSRREVSESEGRRGCGEGRYDDAGCRGGSGGMMVNTSKVGRQGAGSKRLRRNDKKSARKQTAGNGNRGRRDGMHGLVAARSGGQAPAGPRNYPRGGNKGEETGIKSNRMGNQL